MRSTKWLSASNVSSQVLAALCMSLTLAGCQNELVDVPTSECASGRKWDGGNSGSPLMHPGRDCKQCHDFVVAGTVYPIEGLNDANDCAGIPGVSVLVEDTAGKMFSLETNEAGNFYLTRRNGSVTFPLTLSAETASETRQMAMQAETGACASCHTEAGANTAAGRIVMAP
jgi:hypothetical protein